MSIALDGAAASTSEAADADSTVTLAYTVGAGSDRLLLVCVSTNHASTVRTVSTITWQGAESFTVLGSRTNGRLHAAIWALINPTSGAGNIVVTLSGTGSSVVVGAQAWTGVNQVKIDYERGSTISSNSLLSSWTWAAVKDFPQVAVVAAGIGATGSVNAGNSTELWRTNITTDATVGGASQYRLPGEGTGNTQYGTLSWPLSPAMDWAYVWCTLQATDRPGYDNATGGTFNSGSTGTVSSFAVGAGANRLLIVFVCIRNSSSQTATAVSYGAQSFNIVDRQVIANSTSVRLEMWRLVAPTTGTANVVVTLSASAKFTISVISLMNVDQTTPFRTATTATGASGTMDLTLATSSLNDWAIGCLCQTNATPSAALSLSTRHQGATSGGTASTNIGVGAASRGRSLTFLFRWTQGATYAWAAWGAAVIGAAGGATLDRSASRTGTISSTRARVGTFGRAPTRTGSVTTATARAGTFGRTDSFTGSVATSTARVSGKNRAVTRTGTITATPTRGGTFGRAITRTGSVSAAPLAVVIPVGGVTHNRSASVTGSVGTAVARAGVFGRAPARTGSVAITTARSGTFARTRTRTGTVSVSPVRTGVFVRPITRTGSVVTADAASVVSGATFITFGNVSRRIPAIFFPSATLYYLEVVLTTTDAGFPAQARLYNITTDVPVSGSDISSTALPTDTIQSKRKRSPSFALTGNNQYRVEFGGPTSIAIYRIHDAAVVVDV